MDLVAVLQTPSGIGTIVAILLAIFVLPEVHERLERYTNRRRRKQAQPEDTEITVSALVVYPIKSCGGVHVQECATTCRGLALDRQWMIVDGLDGNFVTQRQEPKMALIAPKALPKDSYSPLVLTAPGQPNVTVPVIHGPVPPFRFMDAIRQFLASFGGSSSSQPVPPSTAKALEGAVRDVKVWGELCPGVDQGDAVADWLEKALNRPGVRLVRFPGDPSGVTSSYRRPCAPEYASGFETGYADGFPLLLTSEESLADLNARIEQNTPTNAGAANAKFPALPMNRFRPNIVVKGCNGPWQEDQWLKLRIGDVAMKVVKPCSRCKIPTTNQATGVADAPRPGVTGGAKKDAQGFGASPCAEAEPTRTLRTFRTGAHLKLKPSWRDEVYFGQNLVAASGSRVRVGDRVEVTAKQPWVTWGL